jgi:hypothetical protein
MNQRYFRSDEATYESIRQTLDQAWGLPNDRGTTTCFRPAATAPRDIQGRVLLAVDAAFTKFTVAVDVLPELLASGTVTEITEAEYRASMPQVP